MSKHETPSRSDEWYTPQHVFTALGCRFDMDVASPGIDAVPWVPSNYHIVAGSLEKEWTGFIWMNPPFGGRNGLIPWLDKFTKHGNGIALTPDRTSAPWWRRFAPMMDAILFVSPKLHFVPGPGALASSPAQGTSLMAMGLQGIKALRRAADNGLGTLCIPSRASVPGGGRSADSDA